MLRILRPRWSIGTIVPLLFVFLSTFASLFGQLGLVRDTLRNMKGTEAMERIASWAAFMVLPQLILSVGSLAHAIGCCRFLPTIAEFPALLVNPVLTPFTFGVYKKQGHVALSPSLSLVNVATRMVASLLYFFFVQNVYRGKFIAILSCLLCLLAGQLFALPLLWAVHSKKRNRKLPLQVFVRLNVNVFLSPGVNLSCIRAKMQCKHQVERAVLIVGDSGRFVIDKEGEVVPEEPEGSEEEQDDEAKDI